MAEYGIDLDELARPVQAGGKRLHVRERHELVLAHRDERRRRSHLGGIHLMQVDRLAQGEEGLGAVLLHVVVAAREQVFFDWKAEAIRIAYRRTTEAQLKFHRTAV